MRFLKYEKLLSRARTGVPLSADVRDIDRQACPRGRNWRGRDDGSIIVRTVRLAPGRYEYYLSSYCYNATHAADRRTGSYAFEPTFLLKRSRFEKERLK